MEVIESTIEKAKQEMEEKITSEVARLEADAKTSLEIQSRSLAGIDAALQALSVRVDGYASERRQSSAIVRMEIQALRKDAATNERVTLLEEILRDEVGQIYSKKKKNSWLCAFATYILPLILRPHRHLLLGRA